MLRTIRPADADPAVPHNAVDKLSLIGGYEMDYGRLLRRAWDIIWAHKFLILLGVLVALVAKEVLGVICQCT